jgi:hypothetical protein
LAAKPLTVLRAELLGAEEASWEELFAGYTTLKPSPFSSSIAASAQRQSDAPKRRSEFKNSAHADGPGCRTRLRRVAHRE